MPDKSKIVNKPSNPDQTATVNAKPKPIKLADLKVLHERFGTGKAVAEYLGYTWRGYMHIRARLKNGQTLNARLEGLIRYKLSQLEPETLNKESQS